MASSGTTSFNPSIGELVLYSFGLIGIRRTAIAQEHLVDARMAANLMLADWDNSTPNLWKVSLVETALIPGQATYNVDPSTIMILDTYIRTNAGEEDEYDRIIWPVSRTEYASYPNKEIQAPPTTFWFDRLLAPTITLWQVPDDTEDYLLRYYAVTQIYDADLPAGETLDIPVWWLSAFAYGLASRLADSYPPQNPVVAQRVDSRAAQTLEAALAQNTEAVPVYISPSVNGYYPR